MPNIMDILQAMSAKYGGGAEERAEDQGIGDAYDTFAGRTPPSRPDYPSAGPLTNIEDKYPSTKGLMDRWGNRRESQDEAASRDDQGIDPELLKIIAILRGMGAKYGGSPPPGIGLMRDMSERLGGGYNAETDDELPRFANSTQRHLRSLRGQ